MLLDNANTNITYKKDFFSSDKEISLYENRPNAFFMKLLYVRII